MQWMLDAPLHTLMRQAAAIRDERPDNIVTFSPKVFLPVTKLCRDTCGYCTFAQPPRPGQRSYMLPDEVLQTALDGQAAGCTEALITVGDKPELNYPEAAQQLRDLGFDTSIGYIAHVCALILRHTALLPHVNAGVVSKAEVAALRDVSVSAGLMLETGSAAVLQPGSAHYDCPDKILDKRLKVIRDAGELRVPFTSGLLVGIGESPSDRIMDLVTLRKIHREHGNLQELIIQPFRAKPGTRMADWAEPSAEEFLRTISIARILFGATFSIQAPPNLSAAPGSTTEQQVDSWKNLLDAGINDFGGISPLTRDYVNPESAWPHLSHLCAATADKGKILLPRLPIYPEYLQNSDKWLSDKPVTLAVGASPAALPAPGFGKPPLVCSPLSAVLQASDASGLARACSWHAGKAQPSEPDEGAVHTLTTHDSQPQHAAGRLAEAPVVPRPRKQQWKVERGVHGVLEGYASPPVSATVQNILARHDSSEHAVLRSAIDVEWTVNDVQSLLSAHGRSAEAVVHHADALRKQRCGDGVSYVVNRNINYTNICTYACGFCAFSKGRVAEEARDAAYLLPLDEIQRRVAEAWDRGATEVCLQGGIHPEFTGDTYLRILQACKEAVPDIHVHAFSPLEVLHGAQSLGLPIQSFLQRLKDAGLGSLPGTAAEVLTDRVRSIICPDKLSAAEWIEVVEGAHAVGLRTTSTIMFGHVDSPRDWAEHLLAIRGLQQRTGGITEFVPLPFVHMEAPLYRLGRARMGPTLHEAVMMHAVARIVLDPLITNIQASWVKMGPQWASKLLAAGANDMGGSIMNESITKAAGAAHGQELTPSEMERLIKEIGRSPWQRSTTYGVAEEDQVNKSFRAAACQDCVTTGPRVLGKWSGGFGAM